MADLPEEAVELAYETQEAYSRGKITTIINAAAPAIRKQEQERLTALMRSDDFVREARRRYGHPSDPSYAERFRVFMDAAFDTLAALEDSE